MDQCGVSRQLSVQLHATGRCVGCAQQFALADEESFPLCLKLEDKEGASERRQKGVCVSMPATFAARIAKHRANALLVCHLCLRSGPKELLGALARPAR